MKICFVSVDIEKDLDQESFKGVENLENILDIFRIHNIKATLFVTGEILEKYPDLVREWSKNHEIACHNYYHIVLDNLNLANREKQLRNFVDLYKKILGEMPQGFKAPRHIIDNRQFKLLEKYNFLYDSSVIPSYPFFKKYEGYRGRAPQQPYKPSESNYLRKGNMEILEIPNASLILGVPLVGTWIRKLGIGVFGGLFFLKKPKFLSLAMHSWDGIKFEGRSSKNSGGAFLRQLDEILGLLRTMGYEFKSGEQILHDADMQI